MYEYVVVLGMMVTNQNCFHAWIKSRLNLWNACNSECMPYCLLSKTIKIKICKTTILRIPLYWVWNLDSYAKRRTLIDGVWESAKRTGGWKKLHHEELYNV